ncbi:segmentation protein cap'n'collar isoform X2 [Malaya genurostris]|uniref:segmentation protein cap'n'collar isoform X2 n=1 Tax=Malaya genurostris TaxID=325434 RepID=UPI0026F3EAA3|nr:segmentation protein cap'n'collar isoform X2 [Malaya genurostris]XP_058449729.1 segmentation protein cap'n'collar isoform X2 [Malaya genurostris]XP_058449740.1 segmentation protein cap'n'collar isoform X2 [Malaya genurostris]
MALEYEDLPRMQSLTPDPETISLKDDGLEVAVIDRPIENIADTTSNSNMANCDSRSQSPMFSYNKYNHKEMDLIEVLWKQDVDLGFTLTAPTAVAAGSGTAKGGANSSDDLEKLKVLLEIKDGEDKRKDDKQEAEEDPWAGLSYTVDTETGEYVLNVTDVDSEATLPPPLADLFLAEELNLPELINDSSEETNEERAKTKTTAEEEEEESEVKRIERELETSADELCQGAAASTSGSCDSSFGSSAADTSSLVSGTDSSLKELGTSTPEKDQGISVDVESDTTAGSAADDLENLLCDMMIQTSSGHFQHPRQPMQNYGHGMHGTLRQSGYHHHHHHHHHQSRVPLSRAVSVEQRWQDLANLLSFPPGMGVGMGVGEMPPAHPHPHYPPHYSYQSTGAIPQHGQYHTHAAVLQNASLADIGPTQPHYGPNLGSAVATSMHLTNSTSETDAGATGYKMDHEMMYYSNASSEMNHTDGFLNSILDDDLQLMDIAVNEGMYTMRMLEHNTSSSNSSVLGGAVGGGSVVGLNNSTHLGGLMSSAAVAASAAAAAGAMQTSLAGSANGGGHGPNGATTGGTTSGDRLDASSDSAVSSMGSERVPSLSDGEWGDGGSDSAQEYHNKYGGPFDYSYNSSSRLGDVSRQPPVAQKKHHMFAKRYFQEQNTTIPALAPSNNTTPATGVDHQAQLNASIPIKYEYDYMTPTSLNHLEGAVGPITKQEDQTSAHNPLSSVDMKYPYSLDFSRQNPSAASAARSLHHDVIHHNHTYTLPHNNGANPKPQTRDKRIRKSEEEHLTRDEKRARNLQIPIAVQDIINLPMDEFNERLSKYDLNEQQLSLIRDIRRRGKNKVAAQNCRKRKLDQIVSLADEVKEMKMRKERLLHDQDVVLSERKRIRDKFAALHRHVFQNLRDSEGNLYSPEHYSLQQSADGSVVLVPRRIDRQPDLAGSNSHHQQQQQQQQQLGMNSVSAAAAAGGGGGLQHSHQNLHHHHPHHHQHHPQHHSSSQHHQSNGTPSSGSANNTSQHRTKE